MSDKLQITSVLLLEKIWLQKPFRLNKVNHSDPSYFCTSEKTTSCVIIYQKDQYYHPHYQLPCKVLYIDFQCRTIQSLLWFLSKICGGSILDILSILK